MANGKPYFGSWSHKYEIPQSSLITLENQNIWFSRTSDHIDPDSFDIFKNKNFNSRPLWDRIYNDLKLQFNCIKLKSNEWFEITKNVRIKSFSDWNQDASLIIEINKKDIILNLNDGSGLGWSKTIKKLISNYKNRFLLKLINWGDADMINIYNHPMNFYNLLLMKETMW